MNNRCQKNLAVLCILDGWGVSPVVENNAIAQANTPVWNRLLKLFPNSCLDAAEHHVGLPRGQMGNSEVGHMNLGAGRVVRQNLSRIDAAIKNHSLASNIAIEEFIAELKASGGVAHLLGLLSPGGIHSHQDHITTLAKLLNDSGIEVVIHAFLDGRDTPPKSALHYVKKFCTLTPFARIATVSGRYYAMDRDQRHDRTALAYNALVEGDGKYSELAVDAIKAAYIREETDEFVLPTVISGYTGMKDGDGLLMANLRADRVRQILSALLDPEYTGFARNRMVGFSSSVGMISYSSNLNKFSNAIFPPNILKNTIGHVVASAGMTQLRIAETEKYAHVTFFFSGGEELKLPGEKRILIPSPKVKTYDLKPEMSAVELTDSLINAVVSKEFNFIVVNYANTDMVGHTGSMKAAIHAVETVDSCLGKLVEAVNKVEGTLFVTADHGNVEMMTDMNSAQAHTAHTCNPVPAILATHLEGVKTINNGTLADVAPTLLDLMGLPKPHDMTGNSLITSAGNSRATS